MCCEGNVTLSTYWHVGAINKPLSNTMFVMSIVQSLSWDTTYVSGLSRAAAKGHGKAAAVTGTGAGARARAGAGPGAGAAGGPSGRDRSRGEAGARQGTA